MTVTLEICIDSIDSAIAAKDGGADRLEVCGSLATGGITPSYGLVKRCVALELPVMMMLRPNGGGFDYAENDIECMLEDIEAGKQLGVHGFVFGCLNKQADIHREHCQRLLDAIGSNYQTTFHRAFDMMDGSPPINLETLIDLGFDRLLTSGRASSAHEGRTLIGQLVEKAAGQIVILAGAGIGADNAAEIVASTGVNEIHASASVDRFSIESESKNGPVSFGSKDRVTCPNKVSEIKARFTNRP